MSYTHTDVAAGDTITAAGYNAIGNALEEALDQTAADALYAPLSHTQTASTITDFTEAVQDVAGAAIVAGSGVSVTYDDTAGTITITSTYSLSTEDVQDIIGGLVVAGTGPITVTYNDAGNTLTISSSAITQATADTLYAALSHTHTATQISDSTSIGRAVLTAADAAAVRTAIGAGTGSGSGDLLSTNNLSDLANAATARTNLGLGTAATKDTGTAAGQVPLRGTGGKITFTNGAVNDDTSGQLVLATGSNTLFVYSGTSGIQFTNQANTTAIATLSNAGALNVAGNVTAANLSGTNTGDQPLDTTTHAATSKTTPVDADELPLVDSAASNALKKLTWANLKATAKTYFDTLYAAATHTHAEADITNLVTDLAAKAPLASPTFTGTPVAPTATAGTNTTQIATTAFVTTAVAAGGSSSRRPIFEDAFMDGGSGAGNAGMGRWNGTVSRQGSEAGHPGIVRVSSSTTNNSNATINLQVDNTTGVISSDDLFDWTFVFRPNSNDTSTTYEIGFVNQLAGGWTYYAFLEKQSASTTWDAVTKNISSTRTSTGVSVTVAWTKVRIRRIDSSTIGFTVNGGTEVTITTNLPPSIRMMPCFVVSTQNGVSKSIDIDHVVAYDDSVSY